jgi:glucose/arabinose dehydrogenase
MRRRPSARVAALAVTGLVATGVVLLTTDSGPAAALVPDQFTDSLYVQIPSPTAIAFTPDGRMLVATQPGVLRMVKDGVRLPTPALDLSARTCSDSERGMLGVAADPASSPGYVYIFWTPRGASGGCPGSTTGNPEGAPRNRVSRFTLGSADVIDPATELVLLDGIYSPAGNHNAGDLAVGKDGNLYVTTGDGGCDYAGNSGCGGANDASRDKNILNGKILRITRTGGIPAGNPFTGTGTARCNTGPAPSGTICQETFASGLRNPFRFAMDPNASGTVFRINDVGQNAWEEINLGAAGANYGWPGSEGPGNVGAGIAGPLFAYRHDDANPPGSGPGGFFKGFAIAGGAFYPVNGPFPAGYRDQYYFADFVSQFVGRLDVANGNAAYAFARLSGAPVDMLVGSDGALHVLTRGGITRISAP